MDRPPQQFGDGVFDLLRFDLALLCPQLETHHVFILLGGIAQHFRGVEREPLADLGNLFFDKMTLSSSI